MRGLILAASVFAACMFVSQGASAHAHHRRHHRVRAAHARILGRHKIAAPGISISEIAAASPLAVAELRDLGKGNITGFTGPWCGAYQERKARMLGLYVPPAPLSARSWANAGRRLKRPEPGAYLVMPHHVALILKAVGDWILTVSGNHGNRVGLGWYKSSRAIAFVQPVRR